MTAGANQSSSTDSKPATTTDQKNDLTSMPMSEVEKQLCTSPDGLSQAEAEKRLAQYGPNEIEIWDFDATANNQYPLLLHFPHFNLYRKQVVKQADLVLAMHLRGDAFTAAQKARNFAYYEALTVRDSSLSACTQAVLAAETGHLGLAYDYLTESALMDLDDREHNTRDGLHVASLAGTWIALVPGLAGLRERDGSVAFSPRLPAGITRLALTICVQNSRLNVEITPATTTYRIVDGQPLSVWHDGQALMVSAGTPITSPTLSTPSCAAPTQPPGRAPQPHRGAS